VAAEKDQKLTQLLQLIQMIKIVAGHRLDDSQEGHRAPFGVCDRPVRSRRKG
jgi:hypothetical protein